MQDQHDRESRFIANHEILRKEFRWEHALARQFGALLLMKSNNTPNAESIKSMRTRIRKETSVFSGFRGVAELMMAILLYSEPDSNQLFERTRSIYNQLRKSSFHGSTYLPLAAFVLAKNTPDTSIADVIIRMQDIFKGMKSRHFWLTGDDDYIYAALLAITDLAVDIALDRMEEYYQDLSQAGFYKGNGLQSLTHVLTLGEECFLNLRDRTERLNRYLIERKYRLSNYQLPVLGVMVLVSDRPEDLADQAIDLEKRLKGNPGFGSFSIDRKTRFVLATSLIIGDWVENSAIDMNRVVLANSIQTILIAEQIAIFAAVIAATSASAAASGG